jgi:Fe-S cluster assembly protein SufD
MTESPSVPVGYPDQFQALRRNGGADVPPWLRELGDQAWSRFTQLGFPTARRGNEKWKYTNVAPIARAAFSYSGDLDPDGAITAAGLRRIAPWNDKWTNLVFVDGKFSKTVSTAPETAGSVRVTSLANVVRNDGRTVEHHLAKQATFEEDGFTALNTAFLSDGAFVEVSGGQETGATVHLVFVTTERAQPRVTYPRTLVVAGPNAALTLVETYVGRSDAQYFTNAVTEIVTEEGANVEHYRLLLESPGAFHVGTSRVSLGRDSTFSSASFAMGTALAKNDFQVLLDAPGSSCSLNGLYLTSTGQHIDNLINIDHAKPHTTSRLLYKGILDGKSKAVFGGQVLVRKDAQKTDAQQTDKNLLLSEQAEVNSKPSLLIYADDVQCSHGATAGHMDETTLFYLRSRGLDVETASRMLVHAFASEIIDAVKLKPLRDYLDGLFLRAVPATILRLGGGQ